MSGATAADSLEQALVAGGTPEPMHPFLLDRPDQVWFVERGAVDLFLVETRDGEAVGARFHLFRLAAGELLPGAAPHDRDGYGLLAVPMPATNLVAVPAAQARALLEAPAQRGRTVELVDRFITSACAFLDEPPRKPSAPLAADGAVACREEPLTVFAAGAGIWARVEEGNACFLGRESLPLAPGSWFPLPYDGWIALGAGTRVAAAGSAALVGQAALWSGLTALLALLRSYAILHRKERDAAEVRRLQRKSELRAEAMAEALEEFAGVLEGETAHHTTAAGDPLLAACQAIGDRLGVRFRPHPGGAGEAKPEDRVRQIAEASGVRARVVALKGRWWRQDNGPLLGVRGQDAEPLALLPDGKRGYTVYRPADGTRVPMDDAVAATLNPFAFTFYRPLPEGPLTPRDLLRFGLFGRGRELLVVMAVAILGTLLGMAVPVATGHLFDTVIPAADRVQLAQIVAALLAAAVASGLFEATRTYAMLRVESLMNTDVQAAVWDRVLKLPVPFFRDYNAGDLANRITGINAIRQTLSSTAISGILSGLFSIFNVLLLLYYSAKLALVACALIAVATSFSLLVGFLSLRATREGAQIAGRVSGLVLQYLNGIAKLRVAGAEARAFANWSTQFARQKRLNTRAGQLANASAVFNAVFPVIANALLFGVIVVLVLAEQQQSDTASFSTGDFVAFSSTFTAFLTAALTLVQTAIGLLSVVPMYERIKPILQAVPEVDVSKAYPGELNGRIEVSHVSFRYDADGPPALDNVSLRIEPGEFVALVGPSGSGKSTLLRMLLGFERPHAGEIYYDGQNLADMDVAAVRRQLGVVLQNVRVMSGDVFNNIVGAHRLTLEDAWEAARACGLDEDIKAMPMGMQTVVSEGGSTLSGGQRQRLLIARAIVNKPRILYFDEATSALDNRTQAVMSESLERLRATRVVVAHRLSTIVNADRIFVMAGGRIVQQGSYQELMRQDGLFLELAKRQVA